MYVIKQLAPRDWAWQDVCDVWHAGYLSYDAALCAAQQATAAKRQGVR